MTDFALQDIFRGDARIALRGLVSDGITDDALIRMVRDLPLG